MDLRTRSLQLLKAALQRGMRHRFNFKLTRLIAEEHQIFAARQILASCLPPLARQLGDTVLRGPFCGLRYSGTSLGNADRIRKVVGAYEAELHPVLEEVCQGPYRTIVNIGAAEGFYAIGLARRLPKAMVYAFEARPAALAELGDLAKLNGVADRVLVRGWCTPQALAQCPLEPGTFVIADCESCEYDVLLPAAVPGLKCCDLLVELHRRREIRPREHFDALFGTTHQVEFIDMQRRDPRTYPELARLTAEQREALLYERTDPFGWAYLRHR